MYVCFCTDFRKINSATKPDLFPLPCMEDCIEKVGAACYVPKLDLLKGQWQVSLTAHAFKSCICYPRQFVRSLHIHNALGTFQSLMQRVLSGVVNCETYYILMMC